MRQKTERHQAAADRTIKDIRRRTRKRYSSEEKIRIVLAGLLGVEEKAESCLTKQAQDYRAVLRGRFSFGERVSIALASFCYGGKGVRTQVLIVKC